MDVKRDTEFNGSLDRGKSVNRTAYSSLLACLSFAGFLTGCGGSGLEAGSGSSGTGGGALLTVSILSPGNDYTSMEQTVSLTGVANSSSGVATVVWSNSTLGVSGVASGTASWSATGVPLLSGANTLVVSAVDTMGQTSSESIQVTYSPSSTGVVSLRWDANSETDLAGYRIYYGLAPGTYLKVRGEGAFSGTNSFMVTNLTPGVRYYFAVTAVDVVGNESGLSSEVFKDIP